MRWGIAWVAFAMAGCCCPTGSTYVPPPLPSGPMVAAVPYDAGPITNATLLEYAAGWLDGGFPANARSQLSGMSDAGVAERRRAAQLMRAIERAEEADAREATKRLREHASLVVAQLDASRQRYAAFVDRHLLRNGIDIDRAYISGRDRAVLRIDYPGCSRLFMREQLMIIMGARDAGFRRIECRGVRGTVYQDF